MHRLTSALWLGSAVLLLSYINAPAAPTPAPPRVPPDALRAIDDAVPLSAEVDQEAARLRERLAVVPEKPTIIRDPFHFGAAPRRPARLPAAVEPEPEAPPVDAMPAIVWPKLVALLTERDSAALTAVIAVGDAVDMVKVGGALGGFLVRDVTTTSIEVVHIATSATMRLTLR